MPTKEDVTEKVDEVRRGTPFVDHAIRMVQHYGKVKGNLQAGAVTYFAFLSFFPIMVLAFAVVGIIARVYDGVEENLIDAIDQVLPGIVTTDPSETDAVQLSSIQSAAGAAIGIGLAGVLFAGLGWLSAMREALLTVFEKPTDEQPNFVVGKLRDLLALATIGTVLLLSVAVSAVVTSLSGRILDWIGLSDGLSWLIWLLGIAVGLGANMVLFFMFFKILGDPDEPAKSLWGGALLGAVLFEALKQLSRFLLASTKESPAFQAFGIALVLLVWFYYFSRVVMYAAAWAHTAPEARLLREREAAAEAERIARSRVDLFKRPRPKRSRAAAVRRAFAAGVLSTLGLVAYLKRDSG